MNMLYLSIYLFKYSNFIILSSFEHIIRFISTYLNFLLLECIFLIML